MLSQAQLIDKRADFSALYEFIRNRKFDNSLKFSTRLAAELLQIRHSNLYLLEA